MNDAENTDMSTMAAIFDLHRSTNLDLHAWLPHVSTFSTHGSILKKQIMPQKYERALPIMVLLRAPNFVLH